MHEAINASQILSRMSMNTPPLSEIENQIELQKLPLNQLNGAKVLIFGGTGFIGKWLVTLLKQAQIQLSLSLEITVISRNPASRKNIFHSGVHVIDIAEAQKLRNISHIIFGATSATSSEPREINESFLLAKSVIELARKQKNRVNFINLSSGASKSAKSIDFTNDVPNDYATLKLVIEDLVSLETNRGNVVGTSPRLFSFLGPLLPMESKYAAGIFMKAALLREPIRITGNPETLRTYLYPLELISTLISLVLNPVSNPIEIGGTEQVSISTLADRINLIVGGVGVVYPEDYRPESTYIPDPEFNLITNQSISLDESIFRWKNWFLS